mmetsp:Transcript_5453/g.7213  ORF Transcript_5453/g.7213 Transcript_5453/m.7213 type:complete len:592 (+) Transcript_5453:812-2587(+)
MFYSLPCVAIAKDCQTCISTVMKRVLGINEANVSRIVSQKKCIDYYSYYVRCRINKRKAAEVKCSVAQQLLSEMVLRAEETKQVNVKLKETKKKLSSRYFLRRRKPRDQRVPLTFANVEHQRLTYKVLKLSADNCMLSFHKEMQPSIHVAIYLFDFQKIMNSEIIELKAWLEAVQSWQPKLIVLIGDRTNEVIGDKKCKASDEYRVVNERVNRVIGETKVSSEIILKNERKSSCFFFMKSTCEDSNDSLEESSIIASEVYNSLIAGYETEILTHPDAEILTSTLMCHNAITLNKQKFPHISASKAKEEIRGIAKKLWKLGRFYPFDLESNPVSIPLVNPDRLYEWLIYMKRACKAFHESATIPIEWNYFSVEEKQTFVQILRTHGLISSDHLSVIVSNTFGQHQERILTLFKKVALLEVVLVQQKQLLVSPLWVIPDYDSTINNIEKNEERLLVVLKSAQKGLFLRIAATYLNRFVVDEATFTQSTAIGISSAARVGLYYANCYDGASKLGLLPSSACNGFLFADIKGYDNQYAAAVLHSVLRYSCASSECFEIYVETASGVTPWKKFFQVKDSPPLSASDLSQRLLDFEA